MHLVTFSGQETPIAIVSMASKIEQLIESYFNNSITELQKAELAELTTELTDEQIQKLLETAWLKYVPDATMPQNVSENILASIVDHNKATSDPLQTGESLQFSKTALNHYDEEPNEYDLQEPQHEYKEISNQPRKRSRLAIAFFTASAAAASLLVFFIIDKSNRPVQKTGKTFISANGERKNFQLPDGSAVTLNGGSKITIDADYGITSRDIFLSGEAFFDVKHNKEIPFIVHTSGMDIKAVGTAFDVKAYPGEKVTETALINGIIEVTLNQSAHQKLTLKPNQKIKWPALVDVHEKEDEEKRSLNKAINLQRLVEPITKTDDGYIKETAWKENKLVFTNERFAEIAILLERWYGVRIEFEDDAIRNYRFTGAFEKEELVSVLGILKETRHFNYTTEAGEPIKIKLYN